MHAVTKQFSALGLTLAVLSAAACTGEVTQGKPGTNMGTAGTTGGGGAPPVIAPNDCASSPPPRAPLRRLTRYEYNNTARDLLGDTTSPANAFPSELLGNGFGNDAESQPVGGELANQYMLVSETVAAAVTAPARIGSLAACAAQVTATTDATTEAACVRSIVDSFTPKAWRRALQPGEADSLVALFQTVRASSDFPTSVAAMLEGILQSPEFIYKPEFGTAAIAGKPHLMQPSGDEMATRLSYLYWASTPDDALRAAAASGQLATAAGVRTQAERLLADPKAREVIAHFFDKLLPISELAALNRDPTEYPAFSPKVGSLMRQETQTFLDHVIFSGEAGAGTWPSAFTADYTFVNQELATFYGIAGVTGDTFQKVPLDTTKRKGLLTHAGVLAGPIHTNHENPVVRGSFVVQKLLCNPIPFPSGDVAAKVTPPDPNSAATARQRFTQHSLDPVCRACHINMDPVGYALENFDVIGQYRTQENGVTIDASGQIPLLGDMPFNGAIELGQRLADSEAAQNCFASNWMNFGYGRTVISDDEVCSINSVQAKFKETGFNIKELLLALTQSDAFLYLPTVRK
jgi:hypothetical protein